MVPLAFYVNISCPCNSSQYVPSKRKFLSTNQYTESSQIFRLKVYTWVCMMVDNSHRIYTLASKISRMVKKSYSQEKLFANLCCSSNETVVQL